MKIKNVYLSKGFTGFYFDDQQAIKAGAKMDGFTYVGETKTDGFTDIRQAGESISVMLELEDGTIATGDCCAVQYSGCGGRDPLFIADDFIPFINEHIVPELIGRSVATFKDNAEYFDSMKVQRKPLHTAIRYGITQSLLKATALNHRITMAEVVRKEYGIEGDTYHAIPIFTQTGDDRYTNADKMIIKRADVLPHALINNVEEKLGKQGELLLKYISWLRGRILLLRHSADYKPVLHIDVYGTIGIAFEYDLDRIVEYLREVEEIAKPFKVRIEGPVDMGNRTKTMKYLQDITKRLDDEEINVEIVADEWCNTLDDIKYFADHKAGHMLQIKTPDLGGINNIIEAVLYCKEKGIGAYSGGTCNETNVSAEVTTNIAIATNADQCLAKPGMGTDEGFMIVKNEMNRVLMLANKE
jgi:methylaspartate ammonia-lyase